MKNRFSIILVFFLLTVSLACNLPLSQAQPTHLPADYVFPTPGTFFPLTTEIIQTIGPSKTPTPTATPTPIPRTWLPPYHDFVTPGPTQVTPIPSPVAPIADNGAINFLLLGSDQRGTENFRTDTIFIVSIQPQNDSVALITIPRDLYVYIPGWKMQRINAAFQYGKSGHYEGFGPALVKDTVLYNLGIEIDYYALVNFQGFTGVVNTLGGVDVPVACPYTDWRLKSPGLDPEDEDNWRLYTVKSGLVHMDGEYALWYARARKKSSVFDRNRRQTEVIRALYDKALKLDVIGKLPQLYGEITASVETDFTLGDALKLAPDLIGLRSAQIRSYYLDTRHVTGWTSPTGAALLIPKHDLMREYMIEFMDTPSEDEQEHALTVVEVWNGTTASGWDALAAERMAYAGFDSQINITDRTNYSQTTLIDMTGGADPLRTVKLMNLFDLDEGRLIVEDDPTNPFQYRLILGADFDPCFIPKELEH